jgi:hypothetical protein
MKYIFVLIFLIFNQVWAKENCPTPTRCVDLYEFQENCEKFKKECDQFVDLFKLLLDKYDCKRPQDNSLVPAIWLCDNFESSTEFLIDQKTKESNQLLKSKKFKSILDGHVAEIYKTKFEAKKAELKPKK